MGQRLKTLFPDYFEDQPNSFGNYNVLPAHAEDYIMLPEAEILAIQTAATRTPPTPNAQATFAEAVRGTATAIADQP